MAVKELADLSRCLSAGDPGCIFWRVRPDRCVESVDKGRRQQGAGAAAEETDLPQGLDDGCAGLPCRSGEEMDATKHTDTRRQDTQTRRRLRSEFTVKSALQPVFWPKC